jgi:hypothetical protein
MATTEARKVKAGAREPHRKSSNKNFLACSVAHRPQLIPRSAIALFVHLKLRGKHPSLDTEVITTHSPLHPSWLLRRGIRVGSLSLLKDGFYTAGRFLGSRWISRISPWCTVAT